MSRTSSPLICWLLTPTIYRIWAEVMQGYLTVGCFINKEPWRLSLEDRRSMSLWKLENHQNLSSPFAHYPYFLKMSLKPINNSSLSQNLLSRKAEDSQSEAGHDGKWCLSVAAAAPLGTLLWAKVSEELLWWILINIVQCLSKSTTVNTVFTVFY